MKILDIYDSLNPEKEFFELLEKLYKEGPVDSDILEKISYFKKYHSEIFSRYEDRVLSSLGLFYKNINPSESFYSLVMSGFGDSNNSKYGAFLTPVQASIRGAIEDKKYVSISAPTSAGKSYSIRDYIYQCENDAVIIVPSRALIAEYIDSIKRRFIDDKRVMVSSFVDNVFKSRDLRHIFVLTPERAKDLLLQSANFNVDLIFFDEAQLSEDGERGVVFDSVVRRFVDKFSDSKVIFAHPFIDNPIAQFTKHSLKEEDGYAKSYSQGTVGKIFIYKHNNGKYYQYSPYDNRGHVINKSIEFEGSFPEFAFNETNTVLIYVSKASLYSGNAVSSYGKYIDLLLPVSDDKYLSVVSEIEHLIGADEKGRSSEFIRLLKLGVVVHHGSVPLEVRFLVEDLIRTGNVRICFATSTLTQGVNMPFDVVWLDSLRLQGNSEEDRALSLKNLIGRAGRLTNKKVFDFGYVFTKSPSELAKKLTVDYKLAEDSILESEDILDDPDYGEYVGGILSGEFDYEYDLPISRLDRLKNDRVFELCLEIINLFSLDQDLNNVFKGRENEHNRRKLKVLLYSIYASYLGRHLKLGEKGVFDEAIMIFTMQVRGVTFREIVGIRYAMATEGDGVVDFIQPAEALPKASLEKGFPMFKNVDRKSLSYDRFVYDTYDYVDKVISFSLADPFIAAFSLYLENRNDRRANDVINLFRYGTNDSVAIWLIRYGFPPENVWDLKNYVTSVDENEIYFDESIEEAPSYLQDMVQWYLP